jgi:hypothetical protein
MPDDPMEHLLRRAAKEFAYPATPDLARRVQGRLANPHGQQWMGGLRWAAVALAIVLAILLVAPAGRAALYRVLQVGNVLIFIDPTPAPTASATPQQPTPGPTDVVEVGKLGGEITLAEAAEQVDFPLLLPQVPEGIGPPDRVFLQEIGGDTVVLVWLGEDNVTVELALFLLGPGSIVHKMEPRVLRTTTVRGRPAIWATGPYVVVLKGQQVDVRRLTGGNVLIWEEDGVTFRLETQGSMDEAKRMAESLMPLVE